MKSKLTGWSGFYMILGVLVELGALAYFCNQLSTNEYYRDQNYQIISIAILFSGFLYFFLASMCTAISNIESNSFAICDALRKLEKSEATSEIADKQEHEDNKKEQQTEKKHGANAVSKNPTIEGQPTQDRPLPLRCPDCGAVQKAYGDSYYCWKCGKRLIQSNEGKRFVPSYHGR